MTTEEIALRLMEAQLQGGRPLGEVSVREAFAVAEAFAEQAKPEPGSRRLGRSWHTTTTDYDVKKRV